MRINAPSTTSDYSFNFLIGIRLFLIACISSFFLPSSFWKGWYFFLIYLHITEQQHIFRFIVLALNLILRWNKLAFGNCKSCFTLKINLLFIKYHTIRIRKGVKKDQQFAHISLHLRSLPDFCECGPLPKQSCYTYQKYTFENKT